MRCRRDLKPGPAPAGRIPPWRTPVRIACGDGNAAAPLDVRPARRPTGGPSSRPDRWSEGRFEGPSAPVSSECVRPPGDPRGAGAQPPGRLAGPAPRPPGRLHRPVGLGEVLAGLRHHLRRRPAPLRRVAVGLRPPVPGPDGQARRGLHRGAVPGHLHRPEVGLPEPPLDGRHHHRGLRLPAAALRPDRPAALPDLRPAGGPPDPPADRRPGAGAARGHPLPGAGPHRPGAQGRVQRPARRHGQAGLRPGPGGRRGDRAGRPVRGEPGPLRAAHHRGGGRPAGPPGRHPPAADRVHRDGPGPHRGDGRGAGVEGRWGRRGGRGGEDEAITFSQHLACTHCGISFEEPAPRSFSFNSPYGACPTCAGLGTRFEVDPELVVPDRSPVAGRRGAGPLGRGPQRVLHRTGGRRGRAGRLLGHHAVVQAQGQGQEARPLRLGRPSRSTSSTATASAAAAPTSRTTKGSCPGCSVATARPSRTGPASRSSSTCARSTARPAAGPGSSPSRWP